MLRSTAMMTAIAGTMLLASVLGRGVVLAQEGRGQRGASAAEETKPAGDQSGKPLDEQKSAPVQVLKREYDLAKLTSEPAVPEPVFRGRVLWVQKCAFCHDGLGQPTYKTMGPWLDQDLVKLLTDEGTKAFIMAGTGRMPGFKYGLTSTQLGDLMTFLKTVPASDKPTAKQLAGRGEGANSD